MKRLLALLLLPIAAFAEPYTIQKSLLCEGAVPVMNSLSQKFNESPVLMLQSKESIIILTVNLEADTWTAIETQENNNVCVVGFGQGIKFNAELFKKFNLIE